MAISAADTGSGLASSPYSYDNGASWTSDKSKCFSAEGTYTIKVKDTVGNVAWQTVRLSKAAQALSVVEAGEDIAVPALEGNAALAAIVNGLPKKVGKTAVPKQAASTDFSSLLPGKISNFNYSNPDSGHSSNSYKNNAAEKLDGKKITTNQNKTEQTIGDKAIEVIKSAIPYVFVFACIAVVAALLMFLFTVIEHSTKDPKK